MCERRDPLFHYPAGEVDDGKPVEMKKYALFFSLGHNTAGK
jgi:hypothetical protein